MTSRAATGKDWHLSDGEIHYLWWFIQGAIMEPDTRWRLRRAWGMCQRHAWGAVATEAAFRHGFLHGPAILYQDIMERALRAFDLGRPWQMRRLVRRLRATGPCLMCEMGLGRTSRGAARPERLAEGRDPSEILRFAENTKRYWRRTVCRRCLDGESSSLCRPHLVEEASRGSVDDLAEHRTHVKSTLQHLKAYRQSFVWGYHGTETEEDRASLISAVGWCSGWGPWIKSIPFTKR
jgi:hypothetical protein